MCHFYTYYTSQQSSVIFRYVITYCCLPLSTSDDKIWPIRARSAASLGAFKAGIFRVLSPQEPAQLYWSTFSVKQFAGSSLLYLSFVSGTDGQHWRRCTSDQGVNRREWRFSCPNRSRRVKSVNWIHSLWVLAADRLLYIITCIQLYQRVKRKLILIFFFLFI